MKDYKTTHHVYAAWNFDREIADLNRESEAGWQLVQGGCFRNKFRFDSSIVYRYALDYNQHITDIPRYRETFREQGWEYVSSTFNGWHYFRKVYDPTLPEEEYMIYTDSASDSEMKSRWGRLATGFGCAMGLLFLASAVKAAVHPELATFCYCVGYLIACLTFFIGGRKIRAATQTGTSSKSRGMLGVLLMAVCLLAGTVFTAGKTHFQTVTSYDNDGQDGPWVIAADVRLPDIYRLDISANATASAEISITDAAGNVLQSITGTDIHDELQLFLLPGEYRIHTAYTGSVPGAKGMFSYQWG